MRLLLKYKQLVGYLILVTAVVVAFGIIVHVDNQLQASIRSNLKSRIVTVTQRCNLTKLSADAFKSDNPANYQKFIVSWRGCEAQLAQVKKQYAAS